MVTLFLFSEGAADGEAGQLVYYRELASSAEPSAASEPSDASVADGS